MCPPLLRPNLIYLLIATAIELISYSIILAVVLTEDIPKPASISDGLAHSNQLSLFYTFVIYIFALERNGYEFYIDIHDRANRTDYKCALIWFRIIFTNLLMLFLSYITVIPVTLNHSLHDQIALTAVIMHFCLEIFSITLRLLINFQNPPIILPLYISLLVLEMLLVIAALLFGLCYVNILDTCHPNSEIGIISEYMLFLIVVLTPIFRVLD